MKLASICEKKDSACEQAHYMSVALGVERRNSPLAPIVATLLLNHTCGLHRLKIVAAQWDLPCLLMIFWMCLGCCRASLLSCWHALAANPNNCLGRAWLTLDDVSEQLETVAPHMLQYGMMPTRSQALAAGEHGLVAAITVRPLPPL